jgi:hypothetical protein
MPHHLSAEMRACIDACLACYAACVECKAHCTEMGGEHASPEHLGALADCAILCETSANFMLRSSEQHGAVCGVCADACDRCAESCERLGGDDEMMRRCAEACRRCAESCREMAQMAG